VKRFTALGALCLVVATAWPAAAQESRPVLDDVIKKVREVYSRHCCFQAQFNQLTVNVAMDLRDRFEGTIYVRRPGLIALDVDKPEKQKVVLRGRTYTVYFPDDGSAARGEVPPEMNVEHFFGFFANIGEMDRNFTIDFPAKSMDKEERLIFLELTDRKNPRSTYSIILGVDSDRYTVRRAVISDALANYNRFDFSNVTFSDSLAEAHFETGPIRQDKADSFLNQFHDAPEKE
jgi:outer membrane lipoprotein-sorting protein